MPLIGKAIREMFGDDAETSDSYGRIVNERHFDRLSALLDSGKTEIGGLTNRATRFIAPTVLTGVTADSAVMREEIFGPVLPVLRINSLDEAIDLIREGDKPLAAYVFTKNSAAADRFVSDVSCGNTCINDTMMFMAVDELPFGGVGASGMGAYSGEHGFLTFSHMKAVIKRGWWPDLALRYAPYTAQKFKWMRRLR